MLTRLKIWGNLRSRDILKQHINRKFVMQKREQHSLFSEEQYLKTSSTTDTKQFPYNSLVEPSNVASEEEKREFMSIWPEVVDSFINACTDIPELKKRIAEVLQENVYKNKQVSGVLTGLSYKTFEAPDKLCPEKIKLANILGWCVNLQLSKYLMMDDIIDRAEVRYGKPSWYTRRGIGMSAINDATLLDHGMYLLLRKYFSGFHCHFPVVECFHDNTTKAAMGQSLDTIMCGMNNKPLLESFNMNSYIRCLEYKASALMYILPITLGMHLAGKYESGLQRQVNSISCEFGNYLQIQNDILDCYGDPVITGKDGTDIRTGQQTWLVLQALQRATPAQKQILMEHFGRFESDSELKIRTLYDELGLLGEFLIYEEKSFNRACKIIQQMPKDLNKEFFVRNVEVTYGKSIKKVRSYTGQQQQH